MPGAFNRPRLVGGNVSRLGGNDPLKGFKQRGYYGFVGLGSARQKKDFGLVVLSAERIFSFGFRAILILAVAGLKNPVAFGKALYYFGSGTLGIVVQKSEAFFLQSYFAEIMVPPPSTVSPVIENNGLTRRDGALGLVKTIFTLPSTETSAVAAASFALYLGFAVTLVGSEKSEPDTKLKLFAKTVFV